MKSMKLVISSCFISWEKNQFSDISQKCILPKMIRVEPLGLAPSSRQNDITKTKGTTSSAK